MVAFQLPRDCRHWHSAGTSSSALVLPGYGDLISSSVLDSFLAALLRNVEGGDRTHQTQGKHKLIFTYFSTSWTVWMWTTSSLCVKEITPGGL